MTDLRLKDIKSGHTLKSGVTAFWRNCCSAAGDGGSHVCVKRLVVVGGNGREPTIAPDSAADAVTDHDVGDGIQPVDCALPFGSVIDAVFAAVNRLLILLGEGNSRTDKIFNKRLIDDLKPCKRRRIARSGVEVFKVGGRKREGDSLVICPGGFVPRCSLMCKEERLIKVEIVDDPLIGGNGKILHIGNAVPVVAADDDAALRGNGKDFSGGFLPKCIPGV